MKKTILILFLVVAFLLSGCDASGGDEATTTTSSEQSLTAEVKYHAYTPYMIAIADDVKACYGSYQYLPWMTSMTMEERQALARTERFSVDLNGESKWTKKPGSVSVTINNIPYQHYSLEGGGWLKFDLMRKTVSYIKWNDLDQAPPQGSPKLTEDQCRQIALMEIVKRMSWKFQLSSHREKVETRVTEYGETVYVFSYTKYIDGMETQSQIWIAVGESGQIFSVNLYSVAGEIDEKRYHSLDADIERAKAAMDDHVSQLVNAGVPFEVYNWRISQWNGYYTLDCMLKVMNLNGTRYALVGVKIPLEDIYE